MEPVRRKEHPANQKRLAAFMQRWEPRRPEMEWLYHQLNWSQQRMATYYGVTLRIVQKAMGRLRMKSRGRGRRGAQHHHYKDGKSSRLYRTMVVKDECGRCGATEGLSVHHKNNDHYDNRLENLEVLCESCHISLAKKAWWAAKRAGLPTPKSNGPVGWKRG
jgi:5-methylcytosine-specific restriction endonuclease McrA